MLHLVLCVPEGIGVQWDLRTLQISHVPEDIIVQMEQDMQQSTLVLLGRSRMSPSVLVWMLVWIVPLDRIVKEWQMLRQMDCVQRGIIAAPDLQHQLHHPMSHMVDRVSLVSHVLVEQLHQLLVQVECIVWKVIVSQRESVLLGGIVSKELQFLVHQLEVSTVVE